jgi:hypothetical protein
MSSGSVSGIDHDFIQTTLTAYQDQVDAFIATQQPEATVGDVLGTKTIIAAPWAVLPASLPYSVVVRGATFPEIPDDLRHKYQFTLYASALDRGFDTPVFRVIDSLPTLAGKKITLSFAPASQADAEIIASFLPEPPADGSPLDPSAFPTALPGYLIHLVAELRVEGQVVASGGSFMMGQELVSTEGVYDPSNGWQFAEYNTPVAGEYRAIAIDAAGIAASQVQALQDRLTATKDALEMDALTGLTKEDVIGDMLYGTVLNYFAANDVVMQLSAGVMGVLASRRPSFGSFTLVAQPQFLFGIPQSVSFLGLETDIDRLVTIVVSRDNNRETRIAYVQQSGLWQSAFEHLVPELMFTDAERLVGGVSAVKALAEASRQGQRLFTITQGNVASVLPQLSIDPQVKGEIQNAVATGKVATVSQHPVMVGGWAGVGYIILDPETGSGAYKISGGANGGVLILSGALAGIAGVHIVGLVGLAGLSVGLVGAAGVFFLPFAASLLLLGLILYLDGGGEASINDALQVLGMVGSGLSILAWGLAQFGLAAVLSLPGLPLFALLGLIAGLIWMATR